MPSALDDDAFPGRGSLRPPAASRCSALRATRSFPRRPPAYVLRAQGAMNAIGVGRRRVSGSGEPAAPRRQSLLRASRYALLPAATPRVRAPRSGRDECHRRPPDGREMTLSRAAVRERTPSGVTGAEPIPSGATERRGPRAQRPERSDPSGADPERSDPSGATPSGRLRKLWQVLCRGWLMLSLWVPAPAT
jgi:hypothetical protein